jgi:hypothetical protein
MEISNGVQAISLVPRDLPFTNSGLLEVHLGAGQQAVVDCTFAAIPVLYECKLPALDRSVYPAAQCQQ